MSQVVSEILLHLRPMIITVTGLLNGPVPAVGCLAATWILYTVNSVSPVRW